MRKTLLFAAVAIIGHCYTVSAQSTCAQTLRLAQSVYEQGRLHELPNLLENCLKNGFTDQEKVNAYKLLVLTYIYLEEPEKADQAMLLLLGTDTEFEVNDAVDPAEFVALYRTFRTTPIYRMGLKLGTIAASPTVASSDYVNDGVSEYKYGFGFTGAIAFEVPLLRKLSKFTLNPELAFQIRPFTNTNSGADSVLVTTAKETQTLISLPVTLQYKIFEKRNSIVYAGAGVAGEFLMSAKKTVESKRGAENSPVEEKSFNVGSQRNKFNTNLLLSAGFKRKISKGYFIAEVRYQMGLLPMLTKADTYENMGIILDYKSVDAIYKVNSLSLTLGYVMNRYNPKKLSSK